MFPAARDVLDVFDPTGGPQRHAGFVAMDIRDKVERTHVASCARAGSVEHRARPFVAALRFVTFEHSDTGDGEGYSVVEEAGRGANERKPDHRPVALGSDRPPRAL